MERTRRRGILVAIALMIAAALYWWSSDDERATTPEQAERADFETPEILESEAAESGPGLLVSFDAEGHVVLAQRSTDGGVDAPPLEPPPPHRASAHLAIDLCDEALPERKDPPEGMAVASHGHVRVAYGEGVDAQLAAAIAREANAALTQAATWLRASMREDLLVQVYADREQMEEQIGDVGWATGVYDGSVHVMADTYAASLRHEVMHAQLHSVAPCVPYWFDEGLASYFEHDPMRRALSWLRMLHAHMWIPISSLEEPLGDDEGAEHMDAQEVAMLYAQSLAMVAMLDERGGDGAIARAARAAAGGMPRDMLWETSMPDVDGEALLDHLARRLFPAATDQERRTIEGNRYVCITEPNELMSCRVHR